MIWTLGLIISLSSFGNLNFGKDFSFTKLSKEDLRLELTNEVFLENKFIDILNINGSKYSVKYGINKKLNDKVKRIIRSYRSDFTAVAVIDNNTGAVISLADYTKKGDRFGVTLALSNTHPAASIFKIITAADLIKKEKIDLNTKYTYHGRGVTLYKNQLKKEKRRWSRAIPLKKAFAYSNNVVFGKAAMYDSSYVSLRGTAKKFGFEDTVTQFINVPESEILHANSQYELAELASGFNKRTNISPLHAAAMSSIIVNDGIEKKPFLVSEVIDSRIGQNVWSAEYGLERTLAKKTAESLREMMKLTVKKGTARSTFLRRKLSRKLRNLEIGGKTGTITGGVPFGKRDWFVSYAKPKDNKEDLGISVAVMIINQKKWYIKSTVIARDIMKYYYTKIR